ncbi:DUF3150 domain-containing protein [Phragmitibacter flavus]|nr:DUF3150 domain-containing protein [Phragmitibacter flavus]
MTTMSDRKHQLQQTPDIITALTREGVLIHVSVRYWRGCRKLDAPDLGIEPGQVNARLVSLGHKRLLPKETLAPLALIEGRVHALVDNNTFSFLGGLARFMPNGRIADVQSALAQFEREFQQARQQFLNQYQHNRDTALREWTDMAQRLSSDPDQLIHTIQQSYPPAHKLEKTFGFDVRMFQVSAPQDISLQMLDLGEQNAIAEARRLAANEASTRMRQETETFIAECVTTLRQQTAQLCDEMLASMQSGKTDGVHQRTLNRLSNFIDQFRQLNFAGDDAMEAQLEGIRRELLNRSAADYRQNHAAQQNLTRGLERMRDHARHLAQQDTRELVERFGQLGRRQLQLK